MNFENDEEKELYEKILNAIGEYVPTISMSCDEDTFYNIEKRLIVGFSIDNTCFPIEFDAALNKDTGLYDEDDIPYNDNAKIIPSNIIILSVRGHIPYDCKIDDFLHGNYKYNDILAFSHAVLTQKIPFVSDKNKNIPHMISLIIEG